MVCFFYSATDGTATDRDAAIASSATGGRPHAPPMPPGSRSSSAAAISPCLLYTSSVQFSTEYVTRTFLAVMLKILGLEHDRETVSFLKRKLSLADGAVDRHADKTANEAAHGA